MPELPELEALRLRLGPRLEGELVTGAETNPKKGFMLRYPVEEFERELPVRKISSSRKRGPSQSSAYSAAIERPSVLM